MEPQIRRWTAKRKTEVILDIIKGNKKLIDICREHDLKQSEIENWISTFLESGEKGLKVHSKDEEELRERHIKELQSKIGELILELDARKKLEALINSRETTSY